MATANDNRGRAQTSRDRGKQDRKSPGAVPGDALLSANPTERALLEELIGIERRLLGVYATCVTVEKALIGQNAEQDLEFVRCLRSGATEIVTLQCDRLHALIEQLSGRSVGTLAAAPAPEAAASHPERKAGAP